MRPYYFSLHWRRVASGGVVTRGQEFFSFCPSQLSPSLLLLVVPPSADQPTVVPLGSALLLRPGGELRLDEYRIVSNGPSGGQIMLVAKRLKNYTGYVTTKSRDRGVATSPPRSIICNTVQYEYSTIINLAISTSDCGTVRVLVRLFLCTFPIYSM